MPPGKCVVLQSPLASAQNLVIQDDHIHPEHDAKKCRDKRLESQPRCFVPEVLAAARQDETRHYIRKRYALTRYKSQEQIATIAPERKPRIPHIVKPEVRLFSAETYKSYKSFDTESLCDDLDSADREVLGRPYAPVRLRSIADELKALNLKREEKEQEPKTLKSHQHEETKKIYRTRAEARRREFEAVNEQYRVDVKVHPFTWAKCNRLLHGLPDEEAMPGLTRKDIARVLCDNIDAHKIALQMKGNSQWLNDEVVNAYMKIIIQHATQNDRDTQTVPSHHAFNSFFYKNLSEKGPQSVVRWAKRAKIGGSSLREVDKVLIPINTGYHWFLAVVEPKKKTITTYNSLGVGGHSQVAQNLLLWVGTELGSLWFNPDEWTLNTATNSPQQRNGNDCGAFTLCNARQVVLGKQPGYESKHISDFRVRIVGELLAGGLLRKGPHDGCDYPDIL